MAFLLDVNVHPLGIYLVQLPYKGKGSNNVAKIQHMLLCSNFFGISF